VIFDGWVVVFPAGVFERNEIGMKENLRRGRSLRGAASLNGLANIKGRASAHCWVPERENALRPGVRFCFARLELMRSSYFCFSSHYTSRAVLIGDGIT